MTMPIPSHHVVGDGGHTSDHNAISDALNAIDSQISDLQSTTVGIFYITGGNVSAINDAITTWARINLPAGDRSAAVDIYQVFHGSNKIFWLDGEGKPRVKNDDPTHIVWVVDSVSGQTANIAEWRVNGTAVASIQANGSIVAPNITPGGWQPLTLAAGLKPNTFGYPPQYRQHGDKIEFRGNIVKSNGSNFSTIATQLATLPAGLLPLEDAFGVAADQLLSDAPALRLQAQPDGTLWMYANNTPAWVTIDGFSYYLT